MADDATPPAPEPKPENSPTGSAVDEKVAPVTGPPPPTVLAEPPDTGYTMSGVPTLDGVREKIENRLGTAMGATELAEDTPEGRSAAERYEARQRAAAEKLEEIRASMRKPD